MDNKKLLLKSLSFIIIFVFLFIIIQNVVVPKREWDVDNGRTDRSVSAIYNEPDNSLEVLWFGTSGMQCGISPMELYKHNGIKSYNLATIGQTVLISYYLLKSALENQTPQVVFLDASAMFYTQKQNSYEARWRYVIDALPMSKITYKLRMMKTWQSLPYAEQQSFFSSFMPLLRYHSEYFDLDSPWKSENPKFPYYKKGFNLYNTSKKIASYWNGDMDDLYNDMISRQSISANNFNTLETLRNDLRVNIQHLQNIKRLTDNNNIKLVLVKIPIQYSAVEFPSTWTQDKHDLLQQAADELGIPFFDIKAEEKDLIDWEKDSFDGGKHLNALGAKKVSIYMADWIMQNYDIDINNDPQISNLWNKQADIYDLEMKYAMMELESDPYKYIDMLKGGNFTIFTAVSDAVSINGWKKGFPKKFMEITGAQAGPNAGIEDAYLSVSANGELLKEMSDSISCEYKEKIKDNVNYYIKSNGYYAGSGASIMINGVQYASTGRGIRIVVYDNDLDCVVDSLTIETRNNPPTITRSNRTYINDFKSNFIDLVDRKMID